jgi:thioredoxin-related protein
MRHKFPFALFIIFLMSNILLAQDSTNVSASLKTQNLSLKTVNTEGGDVGIQFVHERYAEALRLAKAQNKLVFMDAYTTWCGPCKQMAKKVFTDTRVADYFNEKFVNLKLDMEKGEGLTAFQRYGIEGFPTLLFLNGDGDVIHKALGMQDVNQLMELGKTALTGDQTLGAWASRYERGDREPKFLRQYAEKLGEAYDPRRHILADAYLKTQTNWQTTENLAFIYRFTEGVESLLFGYLVKEQKAFEKKYTKDEIQLKIQDVAGNFLYNEKQLPSLEKADSVLTMIYADPKERARRQLNYRLMHARLSGDRTRYAQAAVNYLKKYDDRAEELSETAATFLEQIDDPKLLAKAVKWAKKSVKLEKRFLNQIVVAQLYERLGKPAKALKEAEKAIEIAKTTGENYDEATDLMQELSKK